MTSTNKDSMKATSKARRAIALLLQGAYFDADGVLGGEDVPLESNTVAGKRERLTRARANLGEALALVDADPRLASLTGVKACREELTANRVFRALPRTHALAATYANALLHCVKALATALNVDAWTGTVWGSPEADLNEAGEYDANWRAKCERSAEASKAAAETPATPAEAVSSEPAKASAVDADRQLMDRAVEWVNEHCEGLEGAAFDSKVREVGEELATSDGFTDGYAAFGAGSVAEYSSRGGQLRKRNAFGLWAAVKPAEEAYARGYIDGFMRAEADGH